MKMSDIREALIDHAKKLGRPPYEMCVVKALCEDFRNKRDNPLKDVVLAYMNPEYIPQSEIVKHIYKTKSPHDPKRAIPQQMLLKKYLVKHGRGCWVKLVAATGHATTASHISNVAAGRTMFSEGLWKEIKRVLVKDLEVAA